jgi:hypothetical protein
MVPSLVIRRPELSLGRLSIRDECGGEIPDDRGLVAADVSESA